MNNNFANSKGIIVFLRAGFPPGKTIIRNTAISNHERINFMKQQNILSYMSIYGLSVLKGGL